MPLRLLGAIRVDEDGKIHPECRDRGYIAPTIYDDWTTPVSDPDLLAHECSRAVIELKDRDLVERYGVKQSLLDQTLDPEGRLNINRSLRILSDERQRRHPSVLTLLQEQRGPSV